MSATLGLYFQLEPEEANAMRQRLNETFGELGYASDTSAHKGRERRKPWAGGLPHGLIGLDRGELALVKVPDEPKAVIHHLRQSVKTIERNFRGEAEFICIKDGLTAYADALQAALDRRL
jgi:hypothetical protein